MEITAHARPRTQPSARRVSPLTREACLREECGALYPGLTPGLWQPAALLADLVLADCLIRGGHTAVTGRVLLDEHFEFRGGAARGGERAGTRLRREGD